MFGRKFRSRAELIYLAKFQFRGFWPWSVFGIWTGLVVVLSVFVSQQGVADWFYAMIGIYFTVVVAMIAYFQTKKSQNSMDNRIRKIEGLLLSQFPILQNSPETTKFQISFSLDGIIETYGEIEKIAKSWKKEKNDEEKKFLENKIIFMWNSSIITNSKILNDSSIVSNNLFSKDVILSLNQISKQCNKSPIFNVENNKIDFNNFHSVVIECILLIDKLKLDSNFRDVLLKY